MSVLSTANAPRLLCAAPVTSAVAERAVTEFDALLSQEKQLTPAEMLVVVKANPSVQAILVSSRIPVKAETLTALAPQIKIIATSSVGYEHMDVAAATSLGVVTTNTPDVLTNATADMAMLLLLGAARRMREYLQVMDNGWRQRFGLGDLLGTEVSGKTLGIWGMGRIGQAVARRARGFDMKVLYCNRSRLSPELEQGATYYSDLEAMLPNCDFLSLHAPSSPETTGAINADRLKQLPQGAILVNTARGQLVNEEDLLAALKSGHIAAAGLDVFAAEPEYDLRFRELPNVFMAPHMGSATTETRDAMGLRALDNIAAVLSGYSARDALN
ncbi:D-glycerate dehydrogenase [Pokkaliibacter sp. MBI-7]|uniref:2-hydroxyacid dehydrogenase n=1 Tax=Pokkaliibacter sp. MBI-7 TaxID=3040600 RepID=UPI00244BBEA0|nr:D-glycerate dehydrogenase [Pokkaliibacter sp. MBI-7]MDH2436006.1 D-glycerate dehydrogenase [Pokkaliibacter sp. MBI-7]